jgi:hypothetical protein
MSCKLTSNTTDSMAKKFKNHKIILGTGCLKFVNPMLKVSKNGSRKHKRSK